VDEQGKTLKKLECPPAFKTGHLSKNLDTEASVLRLEEEEEEEEECSRGGEGRSEDDVGRETVDMTDLM